MTLYLIDIASWQTTERRPNDPLDLTKAEAAGFTLANIKTSEGVGYAYRSWMRSYADKARQLGMGLSTFHYLDNSGSGASQAAIAYQRMRDIGGPDGMAHQCDCEDNATFAIWRDYVNAMQDRLGRPVINYTGDWWWEPKGWSGAAVTPYLWAAPNAGYTGKYPGDTSSAWVAGYGGWKNYSILQYAVSPIAGAGGGNLSKSAIRDPAVWAALTGGGDVATLDADDLKNIRRHVALGVYDALWVAAKGVDFNGLTYDGPGSIGQAVRVNLRALVSDPVLAALEARPAADVDEAALAALLAPMLKPGATVEQVREIINSARLTTG